MRFAFWSVVFCLSCASDRPKLLGKPAPLKVAFVTHSAGFVHPILSRAVEILGNDSLGLSMEHFSDVRELVPRIESFEAVVFFTSGELPLDAQQRAQLLAFVNNGGGFVGIHSATDTLYEWPEYGALIGARFNGHPWTQNVRLVVDDPSHPIVSPSSLVDVRDEIYQFKNLASDIHVLLSLDLQSVDGALGAASVYPLAWTREPAAGRVFYLALGHDESTWETEAFRSFLMRGIMWAGRKL